MEGINCTQQSLPVHSLCLSVEGNLNLAVLFLEHQYYISDIRSSTVCITADQRSFRNKVMVPGCMVGPKEVSQLGEDRMKESRFANPTTI